MKFDEKDYHNSSHHLKEKKESNKNPPKCYNLLGKIKKGNKHQQKLLAAVHKQKICDEKEGWMNITFTYLKVGVPTETLTPG